VIDSDWTTSSAHQPGHRRRCRTRHPVRGGQQREGHQHEHRPDGPPRRLLKTPSSTAVGKGAFIVIAAGNDFEDGNPTESAGRDRVARAGCRLGRRGRPIERHALLFERGKLGGAGRPRRRGRVFGRDGLVFSRPSIEAGHVFVEPRACGVPASFARASIRRVHVFGFQGTSMAAHMCQAWPRARSTGHHQPRGDLRRA